MIECSLMIAKSRFSETLRLLDAVSAGELGAIHSLLEKYQDRIHRLARIRMGNKLRSKMDSMDIVQESMFKAFESVRKAQDGGRSLVFASEGEFIAWLYTIVKTQIYDQIRRHDADKRRASRLIRLDTTGGGMAADALQKKRTSPDKIWDDQILLESLLDRLPREEREIVIDRDILGYAFKELADCRGKTEDAMRMRHKRIIAKLAGMVPDED